MVLNEGAIPVECAADLLVQHESKQWLGAHTFGRAAVAALDATLKAKDRTIANSIVMVTGLSATARSAKGVS